MRIAAVDVGSNSIHLVVVETDGREPQRVLAREKAMVGLARGEATRGAIGAEAYGEGLEALKRMASVIQGFQCDTVMACGTAALRDAANRDAFLADAKKAGLPIQVISGEEEARLIYQAVAHAVPFPETPVVLMDIGGGSTELTWVEGGELQASISIPWGVQRLADALGTADLPTGDDLKRAREHMKAEMDAAMEGLEDWAESDLCFGTSGTLEDLCRLSGGTAQTSLPQLRELRKRLWALSTKKRQDLGVEARRAPVLHIGALWAELLLKRLGASQVRHLPVGLREGMVWEALRHGGAKVPPLAERRRASVEALAQRTDPDFVHSAFVQGLSASLFEDLLPAFELGEAERELLDHAARLHDIGFAIAEKDHHKHGAYMILHGDLTGFWPEELGLLAQIVRYHRGKDPNPEKHAPFAALEPWHRAVVEKLAAILRLADALDRRREQRVKTARLRLFKDEALLQVTPAAPGIDLSAEREAVERKGRLLSELLGLPLRWEERTASSRPRHTAVQA
jgi:exopolyphosphatase/guanosine-5'-triphosphate,3'-diphosphate pyrophosphatase